MNKLVSVILPTYNRPKKVGKAIDSIFKQYYNNIEIIVVNDGSTKSYAGVNQLDDNRVKYVEHEENMGACAARNTGIKKANGEYVAFLDDDDEWKATKISKQVDKLTNTDEHVGVCYTGVLHRSSDGKVTTISNSSQSGDVFREFFTGNFVGTFSSILVNKDTAVRSGLLDDSFPAWQDWEWLIRLARISHFECVNGELTIHHISDGDRISTDPSRVETALYKMLAKHCSTAEEIGLGDEFRSTCFSTMARYCLSCGDWTRSRRFALSSLMESSSNRTPLLIFMLSTCNGYFYDLYKSIAKRWYTWQERYLRG